VTRPLYIPASDAPEERALLVGVTLPGSTYRDEMDNLLELELLARTAGAEVVERIVQKRTRIDGSTYIGEGKVEELAKRVYEYKANLVIFDNDLSPAQARNIENHINVNVIDRTELILDIFARRARSRQAKIQVEIAQLIYALPRLRRLWEHLSRQAGGIGTRGPGETQLEVDRRKARERIAYLKRGLGKIDRSSGERRKMRRGLFKATIVGYTNSGKSTLLNRLAGSRVVESVRLFSTLDSTTRRVRAPGARSFLLTDTVGFIRKLPTHLVASFRATLLDIREADLLIHLVDVSNPRFEERIEVVNSVLGEVLAGDLSKNGCMDGKPTILALNKIDLIPDQHGREDLVRRVPGAVLMSAAAGEGTEELLELVASYIDRDTIEAEVRVSPEDGEAIAAVEKVSRVVRRRILGKRLIIDVRVRKRNITSLERAGTVRLKP
jgi:GTP-binding protein HflX